MTGATTSTRSFRAMLLCFAVLLACQGAWILVPEYERPAIPRFPSDAVAAAGLVADRDAATSAASLAVIRGDLWAEAALTYLDLFWSNDQRQARAQTAEIGERGRAVANRALGYAPYDPRIWLVLASIDTRLDPLNRRMAAALRMSYYTGSNEIDIIPMRLLLAVRSDALGDEEFQEFLRHDIRTIVTRRPELKPAIVAAYRNALPAGQRALEQALGDLDPNLLATLQPKK
jgi:hypothetical protein